MKCSRCNKEKQICDFYPSKYHKNGVLQGCKECRTKKQRKEYSGEYYKKRRNNRTLKQKNKQREYFRIKSQERRKKPEERLKQATRTRIYNSLKDEKDRSTEQYLGCSTPEYKQHLENQFTSEMSWDNWGTYWEIDHIIPLSKGGTFHFSNTQPLTLTENRIKSAKIL